MELSKRIFWEIAEAIPVMLLICRFAIDLNFFTTNPQMFVVRNRFANPQTKTLSSQFADLRTCGPICGSARHWYLYMRHYTVLQCTTKIFFEFSVFFL